MTNIKKIKLIVDWIDQEIKENNFSGFVFGLSGGIDSALIAAIAAKYFPKNYLALRMNINNKQEDILDQKLLVSFFNLNCQNINLEENLKIMAKELNLEKNHYGNLSSRLRMICLYSLAQKLNYLVLGTSNFNEIYLGYFTKYGDGAGDILPIANLTKKEIWELAKFLKVPQKIIDKKPSAGFFPSQTDEGELGFTYQEMENFFNKKKINSATKLKIQNLHKNSFHKRKLPKTILPFSKLLSKDLKNE